MSKFDAVIGSFFKEESSKGKKTLNQHFLVREGSSAIRETHDVGREGREPLLAADR